MHYVYSQLFFPFILFNIKHRDGNAILFCRKLSLITNSKINFTLRDISIRNTQQNKSYSPKGLHKNKQQSKLCSRKDIPYSLKAFFNRRRMEIPDCFEMSAQISICKDAIFDTKYKNLPQKFVLGLKCIKVLLKSTDFAQQI